MNTEIAIRNLGDELAELTGSNYAKVAKLERQVILLTRLVERMGRALSELITWHDEERESLIIDNVIPALYEGYEFTPIEQARYDAAMHEAEGPPPDAVSEGAWGHE